MTYIIRSIIEHHNKSSLKKLDFNCNDDNLNNYIKRYSWQNDSKFNSAKVFVLSHDDPKKILGYYTSSASEIKIDLLPKEVKSGFPQKIPCLLLGRLAVDNRFQRKGLGKELLKHFLKNSVDISSKTGVFAVYTQAKDMKAFNYYLGNGFKVLEEENRLLYLSIQEIKKATE